MFDRVLAVIYVALVAAMLVLILSEVEAEGEVGRSECRSSLWRNAQVLQPWFKQAKTPSEISSRTRHLGVLVTSICEAAETYYIDPELALAIAFRESSLRPSVGNGKIIGSRGERGYFQILPGSPAESFRPGECSQHNPRCNAMSALGYMQHLKTTCISQDPWVWVGAYGRSRCPTGAEAREFAETKIARRYFCSIDLECGDIWPE